MKAAGSTLAGCQCPIHNGKGKFANRHRTCWLHEIQRCTSCKKATRLDGKQRLFGIRERARIANGELAVPKYE